MQDNVLVVIFVDLADANVGVYLLQEKYVKGTLIKYLPANRILITLKRINTHHQIVAHTYVHTHVHTLRMNQKSPHSLS